MANFKKMRAFPSRAEPRVMKITIKMVFRVKFGDNAPISIKEAGETEIPANTPLTNELRYITDNKGGKRTRSGWKNSEKINKIIQITNTTIGIQKYPFSRNTLWRRDTALFYS